MRGQAQAVTAIVLAYAVMAILVSPAVPSPLTTIPSKHTAQPPQFLVTLTALPMAAALEYSNPLYDMVLLPPARLGASGSDVVDLNAARLC
jgi:hypothetical protein